jgi:hypothetical protein
MSPIKFRCLWFTAFALFCSALILGGQSTGQGSVARFEATNGQTTRLASPGGRYALVFTDKATVANSSRYLKLWFEDNLSHSRSLILGVNTDAFAGWSPDGRAFYVENDWLSDRTYAYIYKAGSLDKLDIADRIYAADAEARRFKNAHSYFNVERWQDNKNLLVRFDGHSDSYPVACFDLRYLVSRSGTVKNLSQRTGPAGATGCLDLNLNNR